MQNSSFTVLRAVDTEWTYLQANDQMTFKKCSLQEGKKKKKKLEKNTMADIQARDTILYIAPLMWSLREDEWLCAALDCLDFLPDQLVVDLSRELSHCFQQDQDGCKQLPVGQKSQGEGKCHTAHQSCRLRSGALCCSNRSSVAVILTFSFSEGHLLHCFSL